MGAMSLRALWRKEPDPETAALLAAIFWAAMAGSFAFPGAGSIAREFPDPADRSPEWLVEIDVVACAE